MTLPRKIRLQARQIQKLRRNVKKEQQGEKKSSTPKGFPWKAKSKNKSLREQSKEPEPVFQKIFVFFNGWHGEFTYAQGRRRSWGVVQGIFCLLKGYFLYTHLTAKGNSGYSDKVLFTKSPVWL
ncbi:hypothetical protein DM01DRAFT_1043550 [Hesseltinella vesiculosa]|uniref:Uncharacterized protein n=1 Tax=Hesseltinella vesiculosa TaxID=101127 RepID=A0A1X2GHS6_9FUNG|nr:hypothetical protein DM01DRAFT_1043550 [Hesseltinella vesiculosa]